MIKVICPNCKAEYLPSEIFYPNVVFGQPKKIDKDAKGKIIFFTGDDMNLEESYTCDYCGRKMNVRIELNFKLGAQPELSQHVTTFRKPNLVLDES